MNFPQYRRHHNGNTLYKVLSGVEMAIVHNMANVVFRIEVTTNHLLISDALEDTYATSCTQTEWEKRYNQALKKIIETGM